MGLKLVHPLRYSYFDYQKKAIIKSLSHFAAERSPTLCVVPTGGGKSLIASGIASTVIGGSDLRVVILAPNQDITRQLFDEFSDNFPDIDVGIYHAGLNQYDTKNTVIIAGIHSIYQSDLEAFGDRGMAIIDEAHMVPQSGSGMYLTVINHFLSKNNNLRTIGLTATPYRLDSSYLHLGDNAMFGDISYEIPIQILFDTGRLVTPTTAPVIERLNTDEIKRSKSEFHLQELAGLVNDEKRISASVSEIVELFKNRRSMVTFCVDVAHAERVNLEIKKHGISSAVVTGSTKSKDREKIFSDARDGILQSVVNVGVATTGTNVPIWDQLNCLRPTISPGLWSQMVGRVLRLYPDKKDALIADFGGNIERHGPITNIKPPPLPITSDREIARAANKTILDQPIKKCESCGEANPINIVLCMSCGAAFDTSEDALRHAAYASTADIIGKNEDLRSYDITRTDGFVNKKPGKPEYFSIELWANFKPVATVFFLFEHHGKPRNEAVQKWSEWGGKLPAPVSAKEALKRFKNDELAKPIAVKVTNDGKYNKLVSIDFRKPWEQDDLF